MSKINWILGYWRNLQIVLPVGAKIQVEERDVERAKKILKENGFLGTPVPEPRSRLNVRFLWYLLIALILIVVISVLVNRS